MSAHQVEQAQRISAALEGENAELREALSACQTAIRALVEAGDLEALSVPVATMLDAALGDADRVLWETSTVGAVSA